MSNENENLIDVLSVDCPACGQPDGQVCIELPGEHGYCENVPEGVTEHHASDIHRQRFEKLIRTYPIVDLLGNLAREDAG